MKQFSPRTKMMESKSLKFLYIKSIKEKLSFVKWRRIQTLTLTKIQKKIVIGSTQTVTNALS